MVEETATDIGALQVAEVEAREEIWQAFNTRGLERRRRALDAYAAAVRATEAARYRGLVEMLIASAHNPAEWYMDGIGQRMSAADEGYLRGLRDALAVIAEEEGADG